jgi:hypothetical protein
MCRCQKGKEVEKGRVHFVETRPLVDVQLANKGSRLNNCTMEFFDVSRLLRKENTIRSFAMESVLFATFLLGNLFQRCREIPSVNLFAIPKLSLP